MAPNRPTTAVLHAVCGAHNRVCSLFCSKDCGTGKWRRREINGSALILPDVPHSDERGVDFCYAHFVRIK
jgi:hypothetical protein